MASSSRAFVGVGVGAAPVPRVRSARALSSALTRRVCVRPRAVVGLGCRALTSPTTLRQISCPRPFAPPRPGPLAVTPPAMPAAPPGSGSTPGATPETSVKLSAGNGELSSDAVAAELAKDDAARRGKKKSCCGLC